MDNYSKLRMLLKVQTLHLQMHIINLGVQAAGQWKAVIMSS